MVNFNVMKENFLQSNSKFPPSSEEDSGIYLKLVEKLKHLRECVCVCVYYVLTSYTFTHRCDHTHTHTRVRPTD